jgi:hypothetical protein
VPEGGQAGRELAPVFVEQDLLRPAHLPLHLTPGGVAVATRVDHAALPGTQAAQQAAQSPQGTLLA